MKQIKKILAPIDFSPLSLRAFRLAVKLAKLLNAELHVLHVLYEQRESIEEPELPVSVANRSKMRIVEEKLQKLIGEAGAEMARTGEDAPRITAHIKHGGAVAVIHGLVAGEGFDLIILGTHGAHEKSEELFGTIASDVVGNASCPVMVVPDHPVNLPIQKVAYAVDEANMELEALRTTLQLFSPLYGEVHLVHFVRQPENVRREDMQVMRDLLAGGLGDVPVNIHYRQKSQLAENLNEFVEQEGMQLLIMHRSRPGLFRRLFHRSLTRQMAGKTSVPLLVV